MTSYLDQINAFHRYCELKHLSPGSKLLWFTLMDINNRLLWRWLPRGAMDLNPSHPSVIVILVVGSLVEPWI